MGETMEDRVGALEETWETWEKKLPILEGIVMRCAESLEELQKSMVDLESKVDGMDTRIQVISDAIPDDRSEEITHLHRKIEELENTCATLMKAVANDGKSSGGRKVKAPQPRTYDGARDSKAVDNFVFDMEQYFRVSGLDEEEKVVTASMYLVDDAKMWWRARYQEIEAGTITITSWADFKRILKGHFYPENTEFVARRKLKEVKHTKSIRDYVREFSACMLEITEMTETDRLFEFIDGLKRWAQQEVMRQNPKTLSSAISAAERLIDFHGERDTPRDVSPTKSTGTPQAGYQGKRPQAGSVSVGNGRFRPQGSQAQTASSANSAASSSSKVGSPTISTGKKPFACFVCKGPHKMADCPNKAEFASMFVKMPKGAQERIDGALADYHQEYEEDSSDGEEQPSMGALQRISAMGKLGEPHAKKSNGLMYVDLKVNGKKARALIDSGASHNFVTKEEADRLGLVLNEANSCLKPVNGKMRRVQGVAKKISVQVGEWVGELDFTTVPLDDFKLVLGMQFFQRALVVLKPSDGSMLLMGSIEVKTVDGEDDKEHQRISAMRVIPMPKRREQPWRMPKGSAEPGASKTQANYAAKLPGRRNEGRPPQRAVDNEGWETQRRRPRNNRGPRRNVESTSWLWKQPTQKRRPRTNRGPRRNADSASWRSNMSSNAGTEVTIDTVKVRWSRHLERSRELCARATAKWNFLRDGKRVVDFKDLMFGNFYVKELQPIIDGTWKPIVYWSEARIQAETQQPQPIPKNAWTAYAHRGCLTQAPFRVFCVAEDGNRLGGGECKNPQM